MQPLPDSEYPFGSFTRGASVGDEGERAIEHASTDVDLNSGLAIFLLDPYFGGDGRSAAGPHRALADGHSVGAAGGHRGAKNRDAWRDRRIRLVYRAPEPGRQREDLDRSPFATSALTSLRKERLNMCRPMKLAIRGFLP